MFKKVLVPVDFTRRNERALQAAAALAGRPGSSLHLLHVIETLPGIPFSELKTFYQDLEERAGRKMQELGQRLGGRRRTKLTLDILYGKRPETIIEQALKLKIDLIVLSSHEID